MRKDKIKILCVFLSLATILFALDTEEIRHLFLVASAGDVRLYPKAEKARKKLAKCGKKAVPFLIEQLGRRDIRNVREAENALRSIGKPAVPYLIAAMADTNEDIASTSAMILGDIADKGALPTLLVTARHGYPKLRAASCNALGKLGDTSAVPILIDALRDSIPSVRRNAALSLGKLKNVKAIEPLFALLRDSSYSVRYTAQEALTQIDTRKATEIAISKVDSAQGSEKYHLIVLLGALKDELVLPVLERYLQDQDQYLRGFACEALGHFRGNWRVANLLKRSLWDNSPFVRMKAYNALDNLSDDSEKSHGQFR